MIEAKYHFRTADGIDRTAEILRFARSIGLEQVVPGRYSLLLAANLRQGRVTRKLDTWRILDAISALEGHGVSMTKPPVQNRHPPLKGLWHTHYLPCAVESFKKNLARGIEKYGTPSFDAVVKEALATGAETYVEDVVGVLAHEATFGTWAHLAREKNVTGEWIVFAQHEGGNYYLCLGAHDQSTHEHIRALIDAYRRLEFPFLKGILDG